MIFTSLLLAALVYASGAPLTSRLSSKNTSVEARQTTRLQLYATPHAAPSTPLGAAHTPAMLVPCPQPSSGVSTGPIGIPKKVERGRVTIFSAVLPEELPWLKALLKFSWSFSQPVSIKKTFTPAPVDFACTRQCNRIVL